MRERLEMPSISAAFVLLLSVADRAFLMARISASFIVTTFEGVAPKVTFDENSRAFSST